MRLAVRGVPRRRVLRRRGSAIGVAVGAVLLGLLGMHVLGLHGVHHDAVSGTTIVAPSHHHHDWSGAKAADAGHGSARFGAPVSAGCCDHGHGGDGIMLCLALLVVTGILLLSARRGKAAASSWLERGSRVRVRRGRTQARAGPPSAMAYSVIRC